MKILHVSSGHIYGGIETVLISLARTAATCADLEHHFALCFEGRLSKELRALDTHLFMLGEVQLSRPFSVHKGLRALRSAIKRSECDIVICHGPYSMVFFAAAVRASRIPLVMWVHGARARRRWMNWLVGRTPPDLAICNSQYTHEVFSELYPSVKSTVIYCPIAAAGLHKQEILRAEVREELRTRADAIVIVQASRMEPWKGHRLLIGALTDLRTDDSWQCWIAGGAQTGSEQSYFDDLVKRVRCAGMADRIHFLGQRSDVPRLLAAADILCQPNELGEPFGVIYIEAMQAAVPIVTTAIGAALEVVDQTSGVLVPANDRSALTLALRNLLTDPELRNRVGAGGPARARALCEPAARLKELKSALEAIQSPSKE